MTAAPSGVVGQSGRGQQILPPQYLLKGVPVVEAVVAYCPVKKNIKRKRSINIIVKIFRDIINDINSTVTNFNN